MLALPLVVLQLLAAAPAPAAAPAEAPPDVAEVGQLFAALDAVTQPGAVVESMGAPLRTALLRGCDALLRQSQVADVSPADRRELERLVDAEVSELLERAAPLVQRKRIAALEEAIRRVTTPALAETLVDRWLGLEIVAPPGAPRPERAKARSEAAGHSMAGQLHATGPADADLRVVPEESRLLEEVGGAGAGNGWIDAGEWVKLDVTIRNVAEHPWFSTSAFVHADTPCVWARSGASLELAEMPAREGVAHVTPWVFVSAQCPAGAPARLRLQVLDTHEAPRAPLVLAVTLRPVVSGQPKLVNLRFDADGLGSSDGSLATTVRPRMRFEYAADLQFPAAEPLRVRQHFAVGADAFPIFESFTQRDVDMVRAPQRTFRAGDDFDATVAPPERYEATLAGSGPSKRWLGGPRPRLWVAVDHVAEIAPPGEDKGEKVRAEPRPPPPPRPPAAELVLGVARKAFSIRARPAKPVLPDGIDAVLGYELVVDGDAFAKGYAALLAPVPLPPPPEKLQVPVAYRYRSYLSLPLEPAASLRAEEPPPPAPVARAAKPAAEPAAAPREKARAPALAVGEFTLDAGAGIVSMGGGTLTSRSTMVHLGARPGYGKRLCILAPLAWTWLGDSTGGGKLVSDFSVGVLAGYRVPVKPLEVVPTAGVVYRSRDVKNGKYGSGVLLELGVTARTPVAEHFALFVEGAVQLGGAGPWYGTGGGTFTGGSNAFRLAGGATFSW